MKIQSLDDLASSLQVMCGLSGYYWMSKLTHWGRVTHICVSKLTINGSDNGLSPDRCQAIIWTNAGILLIGPLGTNFSEISIKILTFSFKKMWLKVSSAKRWPSCLGPNVLILPVSSGLAQGCSISIANIQEILQACAKPLIWSWNPVMPLKMLNDVRGIYS